MRDFSTLAKNAMCDPSSKGQVWLYIVEVTSPIFPTLRYVDDMQDITSGGNVYTARAFTIVPPAEADNQSDYSASLQIDNVDLRIGKLLVLLQRDSPVKVVVRKILASQPDTILWTQTFVIQQIVVSDRTVELTLGGQSDTSGGNGLPWLVYSIFANEGLFQTGQYIAGADFGGAPTNIPTGGEEPPGG